MKSLTTYIHEDFKISKNIKIDVIKPEPEVDDKQQKNNQAYLSPFYYEEVRKKRQQKITSIMSKIKRDFKREFPNNEAYLISQKCNHHQVYDVFVKQVTMECFTTINDILKKHFPSNMKVFNEDQLKQKLTEAIDYMNKYGDDPFSLPYQFCRFWSNDLVK